MKKSWRTTSPLRQIEVDKDGEMIFEQALQITRMAKIDPAKVAAFYPPATVMRAARMVAERTKDGKIFMPKDRRTASKFGQAKHRRKALRKTSIRVVHRQAPLKKQGPAIPKFPHLQKLYWFLQGLHKANPSMRRDEAMAIANAEGYTNLFGDQWQTIGFSCFCRSYGIGFLKSKPKKKRPYTYKTPRQPYGPKPQKVALAAFIKAQNGAPMSQLYKLVANSGLTNKHGKPYCRATIYTTAIKYCGYKKSKPIKS